MYPIIWCKKETRNKPCTCSMHKPRERAKHICNSPEGRVNLFCVSFLHSYTEVCFLPFLASLPTRATRLAYRERAKHIGNSTGLSQGRGQTRRCNTPNYIFLWKQLQTCCNFSRKLNPSHNSNAYIRQFWLLKYL